MCVCVRERCLVFVRSQEIMSPDPSGELLALLVHESRLYPGIVAVQHARIDAAGDSSALFGEEGGGGEGSA